MKLRSGIVLIENLSVISGSSETMNELNSETMHQRTMAETETNTNVDLASEAGYSSQSTTSIGETDMENFPNVSDSISEKISVPPIAKNTHNPENTTSVPQQNIQLGDIMAFLAQMQSQLSGVKDELSEKIDALDKKHEVTLRMVEERLSSFQGQISEEVKSFKASIRSDVNSLSQTTDKLAETCDSLKNSNDELCKRLESTNQSVERTRAESSANLGQISEFVHSVKDQTEAKFTKVNTEIEVLSGSIEQIKDGQKELQISQEKFVQDTGSKLSLFEKKINNLNDSCASGGSINATCRHYAVSNVELKIPRFGSRKNINPKAYISELDRYFDIKGVPETAKLLIIEHSFFETDRPWLLLAYQPGMSYNEFKELFLRTFWSTKIQNQARLKLHQSRYDPQVNDSMENYVERLVIQSRYFDVSMSDGEFIDAVVTHFSPHVQAHINPVLIRTIPELLDTLKNLDAIGQRAMNAKTRDEKDSGQKESELNSHGDYSKQGKDHRNKRWKGNDGKPYQQDGRVPWKNEGHRENNGQSRKDGSEMNAVTVVEARPELPAEQ